MSPNSSTDIKSVLILGRDIRAFLTIARSLGRYGLNVHAGMCPANDLALKSRYIKHFHEIPNYTDAPEQWLATILELSDRYQYDLIVPTNDESVIPVQLHQEVISEKSPVYALNDQAFTIAMDKIASSTMAEELEIPVPKQHQVDLYEEKIALPDGFSYPIVIKPPSSFTSNDLDNRREVHHVGTPQELASFVSANRSWGSALIQENFSGIGAGVEILAHQGELLFAFQHLRVHEPISGGASSYRKSVELDPGLVEASRKLLSALNYSGVAMIEYKLNPRSGKWVFIEINARFWGSLPLAVAAGANFPLYLYQYLCEGKRSFPNQYKAGIYSRNLLRDLYWMSDNLKARLRKEHLSTTVPLSQVAGEAIHVLTLKEHIDSFSLDDPMPGLSEVSGIISLAAEKLYRVARERVLTLPPVRSIVANRIRTKFKNARMVTIVCYGNICRSPFAEYYARSVFGDHCDFRSSGFHSIDKRPSPEKAIEIAAEHGIDLSRHQSHTLDQVTVDQSDLVLLFDDKNLTTFHQKHPNARDKAYLLGYLLESGPLEIIDPYAGSKDDFRTVYSQIKTSLSRLTN